MKRNNISGNDIVNVLREANDVINLNNSISNLKLECETWQKKKEKEELEISIQNLYQKINELEDTQKEKEQEIKIIGNYKKND